MSDLEPAAVKLAPVLDARAAAPLIEQLLSLRGEAVALDASAVERVGGQGLQVLLSAAATWKADDAHLDVAQPSEGFLEGIRLLGVDLDALTNKEPAE